MPSQVRPGLIIASASEKMILYSPEMSNLVSQSLHFFQSPVLGKDSSSVVSADIAKYVLCSLKSFYNSLDCMLWHYVFCNFQLTDCLLYDTLNYAKMVLLHTILKLPVFVRFTIALLKTISINNNLCLHGPDS